MAEETVEVTIGPDGKVTLAVAGVAGMGCVEQTEELVRLLGGQVEAQELTGEAYVEVDVEQEQQDRLWH
jgi:hypothetical protein